MTKSNEVERLKWELSRCPGNGPGRRYPDSLRRRAGLLAELERREGRSVDALARRLGVSTPALARWQRDARNEAAIVGPLRRVEIVTDEVTAPTTILVRCPRGIVVEGLSLVQVTELVRSLA